MDLDAFQRVIDATFGERDRARGVPSSVAWLAEEVGELAQAVRKGSHDQQLHEFGDVLAWLTSLANQLGVDLNEAAQRYADGCPRCAVNPLRLRLILSECLTPTGVPRNTHSGYSNSSAIWMALRAAPLRRLSLLTNSTRPRPPSIDVSWRMRPT